MLGSTGGRVAAGRACGVPAARFRQGEFDWAEDEALRRSEAVQSRWMQSAWPGQATPRPSGASGPVRGQVARRARLAHRRAWRGEIETSCPQAFSAAGDERRQPLHTRLSELRMAAARTVDPKAAPGERATVPDRVQDPAGQVEVYLHRGPAANGRLERAVCR